MMLTNWWNLLTPAERQRVLRRERAEDDADALQQQLDDALARENDPAYRRYVREFPRNDPRD